MPVHAHSGSTNNINISGGFNIADGAHIEGAWGVFSKNESHIWSKGDNENAGKGINFNSNHSHTVSIGNAGGNQAHNNIQPYVSIYIWKRTA